MLLHSQEKVAESGTEYMATQTNWGKLSSFVQCKLWKVQNMASPGAIRENHKRISDIWYNKLYSTYIFTFVCYAAQLSQTV